MVMVRKCLKIIIIFFLNRHLFENFCVRKNDSIFLKLHFPRVYINLLM